MGNKDEQYEREQPSKKSIRSLPNSIQSLVGFKRNLTPSWIESVRQIIKDLRSSEEVASSPIKSTPLEKIQPPRECMPAGSDSKTLMLVHVSPNEEDLCETICSLGFATRVRSIHHQRRGLPLFMLNPLSPLQRVLASLTIILSVVYQQLA